MADFRAELVALVAAYDKHGGDEDALREAVEHARAVLLKRQALQPIPVGERQPERYELAWWFEEDEEEERYGCSWTLLRSLDNEGQNTHWLPAHALPLPEYA